MFYSALRRKLPKATTLASQPEPQKLATLSGSWELRTLTNKTEKKNHKKTTPDSFKG
jgi:hypothetical protein